MSDEKLLTAIRSGVLRSIEEMGVENFEKCSFFVSNYHKQNSEIKKAA